MAGTIGPESHGESDSQTRCYTSWDGVGLALGMNCREHVLPRAQATQPMKALVVDENEGVRESLSVLLKRRGIRPVQAGNAAAAMERFSEEEFDFLVTNLDMPETNGWELVRWIRIRSPFLPVIVLSGNLSSDGESSGGSSQGRLAQLLEKAGATPRSSVPKPSASAPATSPSAKASLSARHTRNLDAVRAMRPSPSASKSNFQSAHAASRPHRRSANFAKGRP